MLKRRVSLTLASLLFACSSTPAATDGAAGMGGGAAGTGGGAAGTGSAAGTGGGAAGTGAATCTSGRAAAPKLPGSRDPAVLARAAVVVGSCFPDDGIDRNLADMWASDVSNGVFFGREAMQAECLASSTCGCQAVDVCLGYRVVYRDTPSSKTCAGSIFSECIHSDTGQGGCFSFDCAAVGLSCDPLVICGDGPAVACDATFAPTCDPSGRPRLCSNGGVISGADCAAIGLTCAAGQCAGNGAACSGGPPSSDGDVGLVGLACAGAKLDACAGDKHATIDCAKRGPGFTCQTVSGYAFCGLAAECVPGNEPPGSDAGNVKCEGNTVLLCNAGRLDRVDCRALGFQGCEVDHAKAHYGCI